MAARILYTGPGLAGVTTSVRALAEKLRVGSLGPYRFGFVAESVEVWSYIRTAYYFESTRSAIARCGEASADGHMRLLAPLFEANLEYLQVIDGVVFVADSQKERAVANIERLGSLTRELESLGRPSSLPFVFECNKQDLAGALSTDEIAKTLERPRCRHIAASARGGKGIVESFEALLALIEES